MKVAFFAFDIFSPSNTAGFVHTIEITQKISSIIELKLFAAPPVKRALNPFVWEKRIEGLDVNYARFTLWFKPYFIPFIPFNFLSYYLTYKKTRDFHPDLIHERFHAPNPFGHRISRKLCVPRILEVNSPYIEDEAYKNYIFKIIAEKDRKKQFENSDAIITQTETLKKIISSISDVPIYVVPNGVNTEKFKPGNRSALRDRLGVPENAVVITFSGSFRRWHGVHLIPEIAEKLNKSHDNLYFLMIGSGQLSKKIRSSGMKNTIFLGSVDYRLLPSYLNIADICIAPFDASEFRYFKELGFWWNPLKLFEYMGVGKPVVSFDFDEIRKITGNAGLLAQPGDLNEFIELIEYLINNKKERELLGSRGRTLALKEYDWKTRAEETVKIYETVI